jgi:hypothetical protein
MKAGFSYFKKHQNNREIMDRISVLKIKINWGSRKLLGIARSRVSGT